MVCHVDRALKANTNNTEFNYHPKCGPLKITHLAFADDLKLFLRGDIISVRILIDCLSKFGDCSRLKMNTSKSNIFTVGIQGEDLDDIQELTSSSLSYAGRAALIRLVSQGVECFWLSTFPIPAAVTMRITRLCRNFLWNSKKPLVAWSEVCLPKSEEGLGFRDIKCWNNALLAKSLWNVHAKKDTLWVRWINQVYLGGTSIRERSPKKDDSRLFKKILSIALRMKEVEGSIHTAYQRISMRKLSSLPETDYSTWRSTIDAYFVKLQQNQSSIFSSNVARVKKFGDKSKHGSESLEP
ncbi:uncharacterized protein LOC111374103 [Olea europaea var. sylvestris]|uniref:uncharacterized protein LOC111374103 n=1 Tax=Olea europaea var. sylvestris TaxID=158386 RepID=UPI000C1D5241|nr:uncharacterized protein LOC111374103 [Olea europaea var. sylvestris]